MGNAEDIHAQQMLSVIDKIKAEGLLEKWPGAITALDTICAHLYPHDPMRARLEQIAAEMRAAVESAKPKTKP
jgi:hypothetical protein